MTNDPVGMNLNIIFPGVRFSELPGEKGLRKNAEENHQHNSQSSELPKQAYDIFKIFSQESSHTLPMILITWTNVENLPKHTLPTQQN